MVKTGRNHKKNGVRKTHRRNRTVKRGAGLFGNAATKSPNAVSPQNVEALYQSIQLGNLSMAKTLLKEKGVNPSVQKQNIPFTPVELAIKLGKNDIVMLLIQKMPKDALVRSGAIEMALLTDNKPVLAQLQRLGVFPNPDIVKNGMRKGKYVQQGMPMQGMMQQGMVRPGLGQPGMLPQQGMMGQLGMMGQPGVIAQPGMMGQPGMMAQPGMMPQQGMMTQPGMFPQQGMMGQPVQQRLF